MTQQKESNEQAKHLIIMNSVSYRLVHQIAKYMDRYYLDPILGFLVPGFGDGFSSLLVFPFLYVSLFKVRSIPLTLAIIFNVLVDVLVGLIPFYIGAICDVFEKAYVKNARLIDRFVMQDKSAISEVNRKAGWMVVMIIVVCILIYLMVLLAVKAANWMISWFS